MVSFAHLLLIKEQCCPGVGGIYVLIRQFKLASITNILFSFKHCCTYMVFYPSLLSNNTSVLNFGMPLQCLTYLTTKGQEQTTRVPNDTLTGNLTCDIKGTDYVFPHQFQLIINFPGKKMSALHCQLAFSRRSVSASPLFFRVPFFALCLN